VYNFTIVDYYILQFDKFLSYKAIRRKAFFTMATLLMPLLEKKLYAKPSNLLGGCLETQQLQLLRTTSRMSSSEQWLATTKELIKNPIS
jgi:hypothetical protein